MAHKSPSIIETPKTETVEVQAAPTPDENSFETLYELYLEHRRFAGAESSKAKDQANLSPEEKTQFNQLHWRLLYLTMHTLNVQALDTLAAKGIPEELLELVAPQLIEEQTAAQNTVDAIPQGIHVLHTRANHASQSAESHFFTTLPEAQQESYQRFYMDMRMEGAADEQLFAVEGVRNLIVRRLLKNHLQPKDIINPDTGRISHPRFQQTELYQQYAIVFKDCNIFLQLEELLHECYKEQEV